MADPGYRLIQPAQPGGGNEEKRSRRPEPMRLPKRRVNLRGACDLCRSKKVRCDGSRPTCSFCLNRKVRCMYREDRQQQHENSAEIIRLLLAGSEQQAIELLKRMRSAPSLESALSATISAVPQIRSLSERQAARACSPPTSSGLEFELMVRYRLAYPPLDPIDIVSSAKSLLDSTLQPLLAHDGNQEGQSWPSGSLLEAGLELNMDLYSPINFENGLLQAEGPARPPQYCDERLHCIPVSYWTTVKISDDLAARVLSLFLETGHPIIGLFDADLFLDDMVNMRQEFCSSFLFSSVFALACQSYTAVDLRCAALSNAFFHDSEKLWRAERSSDSIINVAAILMFSASSHTQATELPAAELLDDGRRMAERLHLFGIHHSASLAARFSNMSPKWMKAAAHVAYGAYTWLTLNSFYSVLEPIEFPPIFPIPGQNNGQQGTEYFGVAWPAHPLPLYMGQTFTALCSLWRIMQEVALLYFAGNNRPESLSTRVPLSFAEAKYLKLLQSASQLEEMGRRENTPDHVIIFHTLLHCAILDIFQPFAHNPETSRLALSSSPHSSVSAILQASINQLQRLLLECRMRNPKTMSVSHTNSASMHICNAILRETSHGGFRSPEDRAYFMLGLTTCGEMYTHFPVNGSICRGLLAMAMREGVMSSQEAKQIMEVLERRGYHHYQVKKQLMAGAFIIDFDLAAREPTKAQAAAIAKQFDEMSLFAEYTTGAL